MTGGFLPGMSGRSLYNMRKDLFFIQHIWFSSYQVNHVDKFVFSVKVPPPPHLPAKFLLLWGVEAFLISNYGS